MYQHGGDPWYRHWNARGLPRRCGPSPSGLKGHIGRKLGPRREPLRDPRSGRIYSTAAGFDTLGAGGVYYRFLRLYDDPKLPSRSMAPQPQGGDPGKPVHPASAFPPTPAGGCRRERRGHRGPLAKSGPKSYLDIVGRHRSSRYNPPGAPARAWSVEREAGLFHMDLSMVPVVWAQATAASPASSSSPSSAARFGGAGGFQAVVQEPDALLESRRQPPGRSRPLGSGRGCSACVAFAGGGWWSSLNRAGAR